MYTIMKDYNTPDFLEVLYNKLYIENDKLCIPVAVKDVDEFRNYNKDININFVMYDADCYITNRLKAIVNRQNIISMSDINIRKNEFEDYLDTMYEDAYDNLILLTITPNIQIMNNTVKITNCLLYYLYPDTTDPTSDETVYMIQYKLPMEPVYAPIISRKKQKYCDLFIALFATLLYIYIILTHI